MEGFTKLFRGITKSTVWSLDNDHKAVWIFLLAEADENGDVICTLPGLAKANDITIEKAAAIIQCFMSPDPYSGSKDHEGRRIREIDRGWHVLNHGKYRRLRSREEKQEYDRLFREKERLAEKLAKLEEEKSNQSADVVKARKPSLEVVKVVQAEAEAEAEAEANTRSDRHRENHPAATPAAPNTSSPTAEPPSGYPSHGPEAFALLFANWPGAEDSRFNESRPDAEAAFFRCITPDVYPAFVQAYDIRLANFSKDTSRDRRKVLGSFRTFCESRWQNVKPPPAPATAPERSNVALEF